MTKQNEAAAATTAEINNKSVPNKLIENESVINVTTIKAKNIDLGGASFITKRT